VKDCTVKNSIVYFNAGPVEADQSGSYLTYCCTPLAALGDPGNISDDPQLVDHVGGDMHLQSSSPCINSGRNPYAPGGLDLADNPRVVGGTVDIGAYEFQSPASSVSYAWLRRYNLPTDGSVDYADDDGDGMNNWQEWVA